MSSVAAFINEITHIDCFQGFRELANESIHLVLTDPPYTISKPTGFKHVVKGVKRFAVDTEFGSWDTDKEVIDMHKLCQAYYRVLKKGGTCIIFYDLWKKEKLKEALESSGFKGIRLIIWEKSNPVPLNSKVNYLSNPREIALLAVKGSKPTFHSAYDKGVYHYPIEHSNRSHPTQKPLGLFEELIAKHSNEGDVVLDSFSGSGTTAVACQYMKRQYVCFEKNKQYYEASLKRIRSEETKPLISIQQPIRQDIKEEIQQGKCAVLHISRVETDHKDGRRDAPSLSLAAQKKEDFQPLSPDVNKAKRQHCKTCRETDKRFDAVALGYAQGWWTGEGDYKGSCTGCYWHDVKRFNEEISQHFTPIS